MEDLPGYMAEYGPDPAAYDPEWLAGVIALFLERARTLKSLVEQMAYFLSDEFPFDEKAVEKHLRKEGAAEMLEAAEQALAAAPDFSHRTLEAAMQALVDRLQCSFSKIAHPCRVALTGLQASPGIFDVIACLGRERTLKRLAYARENLCARH